MWDLKNEEKILERKQENESILDGERSLNNRSDSKNLGVFQGRAP